MNPIHHIRRVALASLLLPLCPSAIASDKAAFRVVEAPGQTPSGFVWKPEAPKGCPFEQSDLFNRLYFTGRHSDYRCGDTFYPSWASDGNLYSPWTDGGTDGISCRSYPAEKAHTGHAIMKGDDPLDLVITNTSPPKQATALPYRGRYPAGSLVHDGIWYYGTYCLGPGSSYSHNGYRYNWPNLGPMPGFQISDDLGKTWKPSPHTPERPLFPEPAEFLAPVKIGAPHFVDFGKNMEHSPDGKAYLVAMGALEDDPEPRPCLAPGGEGEFYRICPECPGDKTKHFSHANLSWITADQIYLTRVTPSPETINDESAYEYFAGHDAAGAAIWSDDFNKIKPLLEWNNKMGCVTATYVPQLKKYLMCITDGWPTSARMDSYILEADELTGPWRMVTYMKDFGQQGYFLNFPSKFMSGDGKTMWLCYSANFWRNENLTINPPGGRYGLCLHEVRFLSAEEEEPTPPKHAAVDILAGNLAPSGRVAVSSTFKGYAADALIDGKVRGYPTEITAEWASNGEKKGAWARLQWEQAQRISRVILFDRPNDLDQVRAGVLTFSDGSSVRVDQPLPDRAKEGLEIRFSPRNVEWVKFEVLKAGAKTLNIGLSEMAVFGDSN